MKRLLFIAMIVAMPLSAQEEDCGFKADEVDRSIFASDPVFESTYDGDAFKRGDNNNGNGWGKGGNGNGNNGNGNGNSGDAPIDAGITFVVVALICYGIYRLIKIRSSALILILIGMMSGCEEPTVKAKSTSYTVPRTGGEASKPLKLVEIEGCQYFICDVYHGVVLCHKGNCKNHIHKEAKQ